MFGTRKTDDAVTRRRPAWVGLAIVAALGVASCGSDDETSTSTAPSSVADTGASSDTTADSGSSVPSSEPGTSDSTPSTDGTGSTEPLSDIKMGGTLELLSPTQKDVVRLDPVILVADGSSTGTDAVAIYDTLVDYDAATATTKPRLVESITPNDDFSVWTITLRPDLTFSDGSPFTAEAIAAHWTRAADETLGSPANAAAAGIATEIVDDVTLTATLSKPDADFPFLLTSTLGMIPSPTAVAEFGENYGTSPETTVGAGPFVLTSWEHEVRKELTRNPSYWDSPKPYLDGLVITQIPDPQTRFNAFDSGQGDLNAMPLAGQVLVDLIDSYPYVVAATGAHTTWAFNFREGHPTSDRLLRRAMVAAVDMDAVVERSAAGATAAHTFFEEGHVYYAPIEQKDNDLAAAQTFMDEYLTATGQDSVTVRLVSNPQFQQMAEALKQDFDKVEGLDVQIEIVESALTAALEGNFDLVVRGLGGAVASDWVEDLETGGFGNITGVSDPDLDALLQEISATDDVSARAETFAAVQELFMDQAIHLLMYSSSQYYFYTDAVGPIELLARAAIDTAVLQTS